MTQLLIALLVCHYLADFCLTLPIMIRAKVDGRNLWPIFLHALVHALLVGLCLLIWGVTWNKLLLLMAIELISHFLIDTCKARLSVHFPPVAASVGDGVDMVVCDDYRIGKSFILKISSSVSFRLPTISGCQVRTWITGDVLSLNSHNINI